MILEILIQAFFKYIEGGNMNRLVQQRNIKKRQEYWCDVTGFFFPALMQRPTPAASWCRASPECGNALFVFNVKKCKNESNPKRPEFSSPPRHRWRSSVCPGWSPSPWGRSAGWLPALSTPDGPFPSERRGGCGSVSLEMGSCPQMQCSSAFCKQKHRLWIFNIGFIRLLKTTVLKPHVYYCSLHLFLPLHMYQPCIFYWKCQQNTSGP